MREPCRKILFSEFARLDKTLILESNFYQTELEKLHQIAFENDYIEAARREKAVGNIIEIRADDFSYQTDRVLLSRIDEFMRE